MHKGPLAAFVTVGSSRRAVTPAAAPSATPCAASTAHPHQSGDFGDTPSPDPYSPQLGLHDVRVRAANQVNKVGRHTEPGPRSRTKYLLPVRTHVAEPPHVAFAPDAAPLGIPCLLRAALLTLRRTAFELTRMTGRNGGNGRERRTRNPRTNATC
jgi:hypothetical protein